VSQQELNPQAANERLFSLDFFRGLTMFLLVSGITNLVSILTSSGAEGSFLHGIGQQFHHAPWDGLRFWDLVQPYFMFIVGVAMPYSFANRMKRGHTKAQVRNHIIQRAITLLIIGWAITCIGHGKLTPRFQNVLAQLSVTYLLAYFVMHKSWKFQVSFSLLLIMLTEIIYRVFWVEGFNQPFTPDANFGTWVDTLYGGEDLRGHWVSFNAIPTTAHTIWGVLCGQLLRTEKTHMQKLKILLIAGIIGVVAGYAISPFTPIIKRICTSSFILASGGWTILSLAFSFWLIDIKKQRKWSIFFAIVGMNPLFIYLFSHVGGKNFIEHIIHPFSYALFEWMSPKTAEFLTWTIVMFLMWYICYWLYKKKIFIRI